MIRKLSAWLLVAIVIYIGAVLYSVFVQRPATLKLVELTSSPPPQGATGPSPELMATLAKIRRGGMILGLAVVLIVFLMVVKPTF